MQVGLLALARRDHDSPCRDGAKAVLAAVKAAPDLDLLLCGGWTLRNDRDLERVRRASIGRQTQIVLEVLQKQPPARPQGYAVGAISHQNVRVCDGQIYDMGFQAFGRSGEVSTPEACARRTGWRADQLDRRVFAVADRRCLLLTCGEIMTLVCPRQGNHLGPARFRSGVDPRLIAAIDAADVILNPTHDIMSPQGGLNAKRQFLAERAGVYLSVSNWNKAKRQGFDFKGVFDVWRGAQVRFAPERMSIQRTRSIIARVTF